MVLTSGSGALIDNCLVSDSFRSSVCLILTDRKCDAEEVAKRNNIISVRVEEKDKLKFNQQILKIAITNNIDYIFSYSFLRILNSVVIDKYRDRIFNSHFSILPAFKGYYDTREKNREINARSIFERTIDFGSRYTGNTIHLLTEEIDAGTPVIVSSLVIPYNIDIKVLRHQLFIQECKCILQLVYWLNESRIKVINNKQVLIDGANFSQLDFSPNLDSQKVIDFSINYPY